MKTQWIVLLKNGQVFGIHSEVTKEQLVKLRKTYKNTSFKLKVLTVKQAEAAENYINHQHTKFAYKKEYQKRGLPPLYPVETLYATDNNQPIYGGRSW